MTSHSYSGNIYSSATRKRSRVTDRLNKDQPSSMIPSSSNSSRPTKKKLSTPNHNSPSLDLLSNIITNTSNSKFAAGSSSSHKASNDYLSSEVATLKADLEKVQSLRRLDKMKSENEISRLQRHVKSLEEDAQSARDLAEEVQTRSEEDLERMSQSRREALIKIQDLEWALEEERENSTEESNIAHEGAIELVNRRNAILEEKLNGMEEEVFMLRGTLAASTESTTVTIAQESESADVSTPLKQVLNKKFADDSLNEDPSAPLLSPSPPAVLRELNKVRVQLSDSELNNRQLSRKVQDLTVTANQCIKYRESLRGAETKIDTLEDELKNVRRERETLRVVEARWEDFRCELVKHSLIEQVSAKAKGNRSRSNSASGIVGDENAPPEIATVIRHFQTLEKNVKDTKEENDRLQTRIEASKRCIQDLEKQKKDHDTAEENWSAQKVVIDKESKRLKTENMTILAQEKVWKGENDRLRSLLDTYQAVEDKMVQSQGKIKMETKPAHGPTSKALELSLQSAKEEIKILKDQFDSMKEQKDKIEEGKTELEEEHTRVKTKFGKLRDALFQEREKAEKAEERACQAESLAGKGSYNSETTRALHLENNPYSQAVREKFEKEINDLKMQLEAMEAESGNASAVATAGSTTSTLDAQKLNKRLKESFREQIGLFREAVYLITGFKIDMVNDSNRPQFKVRSMFAEREEDHLMLKWPKLGEGESPTSLDILDTAMAQTLSKESAFQYMTKFKSLPAFMASVCLMLFERQTIVMDG